MLEVVKLHRGGTLIKTKYGNIQVGAPPETIKDTLKLLGEVPETFVIPNKTFSNKRGVSLIDVEFPVYYLFFMKRRTLKLIGFQHQLNTVASSLKEAIFGPATIQLQREFPFDINKELIPDLKAEMEYLRPMNISKKYKATIDDMLVQQKWGPSNRVPFGNWALERTKSVLKLVDGKTTLLEVPMDVMFESSLSGDQANNPFEPPLFGVTVIGSGSGFDPDELTSGFIIWINKRGILVDPPVDTTYWLGSMGINPRLIDDCILTHAHADHDSGILQKLLEEKKLNLHTTETIMGSFVRKYQPITGLSYKAFMGLSHFCPITMQVPMRINGGEFRFFYTFHSVPTIGFEVYFQGQSFAYSSDTLYDPDTFKKLFVKGYINRSRFSELSNFPWHHTLIFHEAGIPPLHTSISTLEKLPPEVKKKVFLIHVTEDRLSKDSLLRKAPDGRLETIEIPVSPPETTEALGYLDLLNHIDLFSGLPIDKAREFLTLVKTKDVQKGECFIKKGTIGKRFWMILTGRARVERNGILIKNYSNNDYIGETSMILNLPRNADVIAETDMKLLVMDKYDFLYFIRGSEIARHMKTIAENREHDTWSLFDDTPLLRPLTTTQRTYLQGIMTRYAVDARKLLVSQGQLCENFYLVDSGLFSLRRGGAVKINAGRGSFLGKIYAAPRRTFYRFSITALENSVYYSINTVDFYRFLEKNPGVMMNFCGATIKDSLNLLDKTQGMTQNNNNGRVSQ